MTVMHDTGKLLPRDKAVERATTAEERKQIHALLGRARRRGAGDRDGHRVRAAGDTRRGAGGVPDGGAAQGNDLRPPAQRGSGGAGGCIGVAGSDGGCGGLGGIGACGPHHEHVHQRDAAVCRDDRGSAAEDRHHDRGVSVHGGDDGYRVCDLLGGLAAADGRDRVRRPAMGADGGAADGGVVRALPEDRRNGGGAFDSRGGGAVCGVAARR